MKNFVLCVALLAILSGCLGSEPPESKTEPETERAQPLQKEVSSFTGVGTSSDETGQKLRTFMEQLDKIFANESGMEAKKQATQLKINNSILIYSLPKSITSKIDSFIVHSNGCASGLNYSCNKADTLYEEIMKWCDGER